MPARGGGLAMLKWISSFPGNPARGLPTVSALLVVCDATTCEPLALLDAGAVTALRTGAVAAVAAQALAGDRRDGRADRLRAQRRLGGALPGRGRATGPGVCHDAERRGRRARSPTSSAGARAARADALACDVVTCVTPGTEVVVDAGDLRPGMHLNMLGADGPGKAEATVGAVGLVRAVLRRVGAGLPRRRADRRRARPASSRASASPTSARC